LTFDAPVDATPFAAIPGVSEVHRDGLTVRLTLNDGQMLDRVIKQAAAHTTVDLQLEHPSLEENFLSFYSDRGKSPADRAASREVLS
jgi:hypothetical protein